MFKNVNFQTLKKHIMTGISYMVPLVVGAGLCMALGFVIGGPNVKTATGSYAYYVYNIGSLGMSLVVPIITASIAYSIADRPAIAPGLIVGMISTDIKAGFLGGIIGAFLVGFIVNFIKKHLKVPESMRGLMPILIIPFITTLICGFSMYLLVGIPISMLMKAINSFFLSLQSGSKFVYGAILAGFSGTDFGGPINKTVSLFSTALMVDGIYGPKACHMLAGMVPPMGIVISFILSKLFKKNIYTAVEKENVKACLPMGVCMITECVIPLAMNDLFRVVFSSVLGSSIAGGLSMMWGVGSPVPHGGMFVIPIFVNPLGFVICLIIGSIIMGTTLFLLKRQVKDVGLDDFYDADIRSNSNEGTQVGDIVIENI